ncbi:MAG: hypothetical protein HY062_01305 [Bacteroidetes bacterium]|nr:hypothetical protein [Bacteroidota bacterium]
MMKKIVLLAVFLISFSSYAQQNANVSEIQTYQTRLSNTLTTLKLDVSGCSISNIKALKTEYENWHGKITSVNFDSQHMILSIEHNALWQQPEIFEMLEKYNISKGKIISDK